MPDEDNDILYYEFGYIEPDKNGMGCLYLTAQKLYNEESAIFAFRCGQYEFLRRAGRTKNGKLYFEYYDSIDERWY